MICAGSPPACVACTNPSSRPLGRGDVVVRSRGAPGPAVFPVLSAFQDFLGVTACSSTRAGRDLSPRSPPWSSAVVLADRQHLAARAANRRSSRSARSAASSAPRTPRCSDVSSAPGLAPPADLESAAPPRFAQGVGFAFGLVGVVALALDATAVGLVAVGLAFGAAFLNAAFGFCLGCEIYLLAKRATTRRTTSAPGRSSGTSITSKDHQSTTTPEEITA